VGSGYLRSAGSSNNLKPRRPEIPRGPKSANPIDLFLQPYFAARKNKPPRRERRLFARRVYLDVIGLLPPPEEMENSSQTGTPTNASGGTAAVGERARLAENWLTFWNDLLRNDYKAPVTSRRPQTITTWLYSALLTNMPYDQFVAQLINPTPPPRVSPRESSWRGVVNAKPNAADAGRSKHLPGFHGREPQVRLLSRQLHHDLALADAYGLASVYADGRSKWCVVIAHRQKG